MELKINIDPGNAAFDGEGYYEEIHRIIDQTAKKIKQGISWEDTHPVFDINGNKVGWFTIKH